MLDLSVVSWEGGLVMVWDLPGGGAAPNICENAASL